MTSVRGKGLTYGQLGEAKYVRENGKWSFQRIPGIWSSLEPIGRAKIVLRGAILPEQRKSFQGRQERDKNINRLLASDPLLAPSKFLLPGLIQVSEAVIEATSVTKAPSHDLLSFGVGKQYLSSGGRSQEVELLAIASGLSGESVQIYCLRPERTGWTGLLRNSLMLEEEYSVLWKGIARCPVEQICYSQGPHGPGSVLAIRNAKATSVLRPVIQHQPVFYPSVGSKDGMDSLQDFPSRIDPGQFGELTHEDTNGLPHISVTLNPWNDSEVAILDAGGNLSVYDCDSQPAPGDEIETNFGLRVLLYKSSQPIQISDDWGSVLWSGSSETVVLVSRSAARIDRYGAKTSSTSFPDLELAKGEVIVDARRNSADLSNVYILTSRRVCSYKILKYEEFLVQETDQAGATLLITWWHQLDSHDLTYRMILSDPVGTNITTINSSKPSPAFDRATLVLVYSKKSHLIVCFTFAYDQEIDTTLSASDPFYISLESFDSYNSSINNTACSLVLRRIQRLQSDEEETYLKDPLDYKPQLFSLLRLTSDLEIREQILEYSFSQDPYKPAPMFRNTDHKSVNQKSKLLSDLGLTTSDNGIEYDVSPRKSALRSGTGHSRASSKLSHSSLDLACLADEVFHLHELQRESNKSSGTFDEEIERVLTDRAELETGIYTMAEFLSTELPVDEIDKFSSTVQGILNVTNDAPESTMHSDDEDQLPLASQPLLTIEQAGDIMGEEADNSEILLVPLYEKLLNSWISMLDKQISAQHRVQLERICRQIAMQVYLSSYGIRSVSLEVASGKREQQPQNKLGTDGMTLTIRQKASSSVSSNSASSRIRDSGYNSQVSTVNSRPLVESQRDTGSRVSSDESSNPPFQSLKKYATFNEPSQMNSSIIDLVNLWDVGEDPTQFDWQAVRRIGEKKPVPWTPRPRNSSKQRRTQRTQTQSSQTLPSSQTGQLGIASRQPRSLASGELQMPDVVESQIPGVISSQIQPSQTGASVVDPITKESSQKTPKPKSKLKKKKPGFQ